jgi:hypothetical protein
MKKTKSPLENKKTSELLDLLQTLIDEQGNLQEGYDEAREELLSREPFYSLYKPRDNETVSEELSAIEEDIKKLKRHKHDEKNGDVLIRI